MKIVVVGASGKIGRELAPLLAPHVETLVLAGRDTARLAQIFPQFRCISDREIASEARGCDAVIHMAAKNNDGGAAPIEEFVAANVTYLVDVAQQAAAAGAPLFINFSTTHVLTPQASPYAATKKMGEEALAAIPALRVINLRLPAVYGQALSGNLALVNKLPGLLRPAAFKLLTAARPALGVTRLAADIAALLRKPGVSGPVYLADAQDENPFYRAFKLLFDYGLALALLPLYAVMFVVLWVIYKIQDLGPPVFTQERVGKHGKTFICHKFRSMKVSTANVPSHHAQTADITAIGQFLRRFKLDEIPQVWNILRGEMSFVGPRPALPSQTELFALRQAAGVLDILPGLTGLAQVNGVDMSTPAKLVDYDSRYVSQRSILLDIIIFIRTAIGGGSGDAAMAGKPKT